MKTMTEDILWKDNKSHFLKNPKDENLSRIFLKDFPDLKSYIFLSSSGTSTLRKSKVFALSKEALLLSAKSVCKHLECDKSDIWLSALPFFHIGGLSVYARSFISKFRVIDKSSSKWSGERFHQDILSYQASLTSLVPTQVFDLVLKNLKAPESLRAVLVGGGNLPQWLYEKARDLGWPLLPTYGLTECSSQVATASIKLLQAKNPKLIVLDHVNLALTSDKRIQIKSKSLFTGFVEISKEKIDEFCFLDSKQFSTMDYGSLKNKTLHILGRHGSSQKIKGRIVDLEPLQDFLDQIIFEFQLNLEAKVMFFDHDRNEHEIAVVCTDLKQSQVLFKIFNKRVLNFERISKIFIVKKIKKNFLQKFQELEQKYFLTKE